MPIAPITQRDQIKLFIGFTAIALAVLYWMYPYASKDAQLALDEARLSGLELANGKAAQAVSSGSLETLVPKPPRIARRSP